MDLLLPLIPHVRFYQEIWIYLTPLIFMLADIITGSAVPTSPKILFRTKCDQALLKSAVR